MKFWVKTKPSQAMPLGVRIEPPCALAYKITNGLAAQILPPAMLRALRHAIAEVGRPPEPTRR